MRKAAWQQNLAKKITASGIPKTQLLLRTDRRAAEREWLLCSQHSFCISPIGFTSSVFRHLEELGVDCLVGLAEHRDEVAGLPHVVRSEEGISRASLLATSRSANAVDIVLRVVGVVKVDDKFHIFNICKIVLQCGIKEEEDTAHKRRAPNATTTTRSKTKVSTVMGYGPVASKNPQGCKKTSIKTTETNSQSTGRLRWEKSNDAHSIGFQSSAVK